MKEKTRNLGRGLAALLGDDLHNLDKAVDKDAAFPNEGFAANRLRMLPIGNLMPNPRQPRKTFNEQAMQELSQSIKKNGILQPLIVSFLQPEEIQEARQEARQEEGQEDTTSNRFVIVAGERRWRAAQRAGLHEVPAIVKEFDLKQRSEVAIVENIQREDLSPLELAEAYKDLVERFGYRQEDLAQTLGKNRSTITNSMRLLSLPQSVKEKLQKGVLSEGHARLLVGLDEAEKMAESFVEKGVTVRQAEKMVQNIKKTKKITEKSQKTEKNPNIAALEQEIEELLGLKTQVEHGKTTSKAGKITIFYDSPTQLEPFLRKIRRP